MSILYNYFSYQIRETNISTKKKTDYKTYLKITTEIYKFNNGI